MGEVYRARGTRLDRAVAVKVLSRDLTSSEIARERFQREARTIAALHHPHICAIYDVGETPEHQAFIVMEFLQGETLEERSPPAATRPARRRPTRTFLTLWNQADRDVPLLKQARIEAAKLR